jgi:hypothetical protein
VTYIFQPLPRLLVHREHLLLVVVSCRVIASRRVRPERTSRTLVALSAAHTRWGIAEADSRSRRVGLQETSAGEHVGRERARTFARLKHVKEQQRALSPGSNQAPNFSLSLNPRPNLSSPPTYSNYAHGGPARLDRLDYSVFGRFA